MLSENGKRGEEILRALNRDLLYDHQSKSRAHLLKLRDPQKPTVHVKLPFVLLDSLIHSIKQGVNESLDLSAGC